MGSIARTLPSPSRAPAWKTPVPRVVGKINRKGPVELRDMEFLRRNTDRAAKITLPGPFTMSQQARNEFYKDDEELAMAFAAAVNAEAMELQKAGADVIQFDEPWVRQDPGGGEALCRQGDQPCPARHHGADRASCLFRLCRRCTWSDQTDGLFVPGRAADTSAEISIEAAQPKLDLGVLADLSSKKIMLGVIDLGDPEIETAAVIADRIRHGLKYVSADRLIPAPDCGMKYMPRHIAFGKLKAMCDAAATVRKEIS